MNYVVNVDNSNNNACLYERVDMCVCGVCECA